MNVYPFPEIPAKCPPSFPPPSKECEVWKPGELITPTAMSAQVEVPLGELRTDERGRLLVLGGLGNSGSLIPNNELGFLNEDSYYANNDYWYDDTSDGPVSAKVVLKDGTELKVVDNAWVIVAPPKYSPHTQVLTTLYDVAMDTAAKKWPAKNGDGKVPVSFMRDISPILSRLSGYQWVNAQASRQHGAGKPYDILAPARLKLFRTPGDKNADAVFERNFLFERVRVPVDLLPGKDIEGNLANSQANYRFMPQMAGNGGEPEVFDAQDLEVTPAAPRHVDELSVHQYKNLEQWAKGDFVDDWPTTKGKPDSPDHLPAPPDLGDLAVADQPAALDKASLDYCVGESTYPGIEMTYISHDPDTWSAPCRINPSFKPAHHEPHGAAGQDDFAEWKDPGGPPRPETWCPGRVRRLLRHTTPSSRALAKHAATPWARGSAPNRRRSTTTGDGRKDFGFVVQKRGPADQLSKSSRSARLRRGRASRLLLLHDNID